MTVNQGNIIIKMKKVHEVEIKNRNNKGDIIVISKNKSRKLNLYYSIAPSGAISLIDIERGICGISSIQSIQNAFPATGGMPFC